MFSFKNASQEYEDFLARASTNRGRRGDDLFSGISWDFVVLRQTM